jgi:transcriptional regulator with XRE-family HTH domain
MTEPDPQKVGGFIKLLRVGKNLTQQKLAGHLDVAVSSVSNWESGKALPRESWERLASYFGVSVDDLMSGGETEGVVSEIQLRELFSDDELQRLTDKQRRGLALLLEESDIERHTARVVVDLLTKSK